MEDDLILDENHVSNNLNLSFNAKEYLVTISKWGKFLAVLGFIFTFFALIGGLGLAVGSFIDLGFAGFGGGIMVYMGLAYLIFALTYGYVSYLLYSFCSNAKNSVEYSDSLSLEKALNQLKKLFVIMGASTILFIFLYFVFMLAMLVFGSSFY